MSWDLRIIEDLHIVKLTISGTVSGQELLDAAAARIDFGKEHDATRFIIDARDMDARESTTTAIHEIPTRIYAEKDFNRLCHIAVVTPINPESRWITQFYEDICVNRGWRVETFGDADDAISWLQRAKPLAE